MPQIFECISTTHVKNLICVVDRWEKPNDEKVLTQVYEQAVRNNMDLLKLLMVEKGRYLIHYVPGLKLQEVQGQGDNVLCGQLDKEIGCLTGDNMVGRVLMKITEKYYPWFLYKLKATTERKDWDLKAELEEVKQDVAAFQATYNPPKPTKGADKEDFQLGVFKANCKLSRRMYSRFMHKYKDKENRESVVLHLLSRHLIQSDEEVESALEEAGGDNLKLSKKMDVINKLWEQELQEYADLYNQEMKEEEEKIAKEKLALEQLSSASSNNKRKADGSAAGGSGVAAKKAKGGQSDEEKARMEAQLKETKAMIEEQKAMIARLTALMKAQATGRMEGEVDLSSPKKKKKKNRD